MLEFGQTTDASPAGADLIKDITEATFAADVIEASQETPVIVDFWAPWCAACRHEMPMLSDLQAEMGGDAFEVITIATSRNAPPKMKAFFDEIGVDNLPLHRDPQSQLARQIGVMGLPVTLILNPEGQEVARLTGDADWASDEAKAVISALIGADSGT